MKHCFVFAFGGKNLIRKFAAFLSLRGMNPRDIRKGGGIELFEVAYFRGLSFFEILGVWGILFLSGFFHEHSQFTKQQKGKAISLTPFYQFHPLHRHLDISRR